MIETVRIASNLLVGVPIALAALVLVREALRGLLAPVLGFRVFELKLGVGRPLWTKPIGPIELAIAAWPLGGMTIAASGKPKHHRKAHLMLTAAPGLLQFAFLAANPSAPAFLLESLRDGLAPSATFQLANLLLLGFHGLIPIETSDGFRTDIREILDTLFAPAESNRRARATYYARFARYWLERGNVPRAEAAVAHGLTQLGPQALLVDCRAQLSENDLDSVVDEGECADVLRSLIDQSESIQKRKRPDRSTLERVRDGGILALPLIVALSLVVFAESDRLARVAQRHLTESSDSVAEKGNPPTCEKELKRWSRWTPILDLARTEAPAARRDREEALAGLEACRGNLETAANHRAAAIEAAELVHRRFADRSDPVSLSWLESELRRATLLRRLADLESRRKRHRLALSALRRAETRLELTNNQVVTWPESDLRDRAQDSIERQLGEIESTRLKVLSGMGEPLAGPLPD